MADLHGHVGIPKCLQLEFSIKGSIQVFDIKRNKAYTSNCDRAGTENNYYTKEVEKLLSDRVESGLARLIEDLRKCETNYEFTNCLNQNRDVLESFFKFQFQRSKKSLNIVNNGSIIARTLGPFSHSSFIKTIDKTNTNILSLLGGKLFALRIACDSSQFIITNSLGFYFVIDGGKVRYFVIPLSDKDAICIQSGSNNEQYSHYTFDQKTNDYFNKCCYLFEKEFGNGYVYAKDKEELIAFFNKENIKPDICWKQQSICA